MSFKAEVLRVLIASPSDVRNERDEIEQAIFHWNKTYAEELEVVLLPGRWEDDVVPTYGKDDPQQIINEQLVHKCDILIGVFWTKLGTPTSKHSSGTLEEINIFIEQGKEIMLYFSEKDIPRSADFDEVKRVDDFKKHYGSKGIYAKYERDLITKHLYRKVLEHKRKDTPENTATSPQVTNGAQQETLDGLISSNKLSKQELLLLKFSHDTGERLFGVRWMAEGTKEKIIKWEQSNHLMDILSENYEQTVHTLSERGLLKEEEYTSHGNVRLYSMSLEYFDALRDLNDDSLKKLNAVLITSEYPF